MSTIDLVPNTAEYLAELERINPLQAAHTRAILAAAGSIDVCQICGDKQARDRVMPGVPLRARLCDDCHGMQNAM